MAARSGSRGTSGRSLLARRSPPAASRRGAGSLLGPPGMKAYPTSPTHAHARDATGHATPDPRNIPYGGRFFDPIDYDRSLGGNYGRPSSVCLTSAWSSALPDDK